jgi:hypothetical protein
VTENFAAEMIERNYDAGVIDEWIGHVEENY